MGLTFQKWCFSKPDHFLVGTQHKNMQIQLILVLLHNSIAFARPQIQPPLNAADVKFHSSEIFRHVRTSCAISASS